MARPPLTPAAADGPATTAVHITETGGPAVAEKDTKKDAARARAAALRSNRADILPALHAERAGYVTRGLKDRVAEVDAQIKAYEAAGDDPTPEPTPEPEPSARRGRGSVRATVDADS